MRQTGNYYYGARYYNPKWSTWLSVDPLREKTLDSYGYCYQNPINLVDPTGMSADPIYDKKGVKIGDDGKTNGSSHIVYKGADIRKVKKDKEDGKTTDLSNLKDPLLLPNKKVRNVFLDMLARSNAANDTRTDKFKGDDNVGGFHEEGGVFSETNIVQSLPGPKTDPSTNDASMNPFKAADPNDWSKFGGNVIGTIHIHPRGSKNGSSFIQYPSFPDDHKGLKSSIDKSWAKPGVYGIVIGADKGNVTFYGTKGDKFSMSLNKFMNIK